MIKIGDFAKICNVSTQTLRYYDSEGILKADVTDASSGYRFYSVDAVEKYKQILFYKKLGFSLDEIKKIKSATSEELTEILQKKKINLSESMDRIRNQLQTIDGLCESGSNKSVLSDFLLLPFEDDPQVVGKWQLCGKLLDENDLNSLQKIKEDVPCKEIIFMPGGAFAWLWFWTKGTLYRLCSKYRFAIPNPYRIIEQNGTKYMVVQFMTDDCIDNGGDMQLLLYRQVDTVAYTERQIRPNIDKTDLPFVEDRSVHGEWRAFDFVREISHFDPDKRHHKVGKLFVMGIHFHARGICTRKLRTMSGSANLTLRYTKGFVLNDQEMTAEEYFIKSVNGKDFLFVQHKSGDYSYGGMTPWWYVFERIIDAKPNEKLSDDHI